MAAANPLPPWVVLNRRVYFEVLPVEGKEHGETIRCASRKAYGCGEHGQQLVDGLTLRLLADRRPAYLSADLYIFADEQARRSIQAEFGVRDDEHLPRARRSMQTEFGGEFHASGTVLIADEGLVVLALFIQILQHGNRTYYLVYDAAGESLSMIPLLPPHCEKLVTGSPLPVRHGHHDGVDLLLAASVSKPQDDGPTRLVYCYDVLCVFSPSSPAEPGVDPWQMRKRRSPAVLQVREPGLFSGQVAFSCNGHAFWADLRQGVLHCDLRAAGGGSDVEFDLIGLPPGCLVHIRDFVEIGNMYRTMGRLADSTIKFVSIDHSGDPGGRKVRVWTLHLDSRRWTPDVEFSVRSLWELESFKRAGLPRVEPKCPLLMPDGSLCFLLRHVSRRRTNTLDDHICSLDMRSKTILWTGRLHMYHTEQPFLLPCDFFKMQ